MSSRGLIVSDTWQRVELTQLKELQLLAECGLEMLQELGRSEEGNEEMSG